MKLKLAFGATKEQADVILFNHVKARRQWWLDVLKMKQFPKNMGETKQAIV